MRKRRPSALVAVKAALMPALVSALALSTSEVRADPWEALGYAKKKLASDWDAFADAMASGPRLSLSTVAAKLPSAGSEKGVRFVFTSGSPRGDLMRAWLDPAKGPDRTPTGLLFAGSAAGPYLLAERWNRSGSEWQRDDSFDWTSDTADVLRSLEKDAVIFLSGRSHHFDGVWTTLYDQRAAAPWYSPGNAAFEAGQEASLQPGVASIETYEETWSIAPGATYVEKTDAGKGASGLAFAMTLTYEEGSLVMSKVTLRGQFAPEEKAQALGTVFEAVTDSIPFATSP